MFERSHIEEGGAAALKGEELHQRFVAAAEAGGGWVSYTARNPDPSCKPEPGPDLHLTCTFTRAREPSQVSYTWRNSPEATLRVKGAYIIKVSMWGRDFCAGVGYSVLPPWGDTGSGQSPPAGVPTGGCSRAAAIDAADGIRRRLIDRAEHARAGLHGGGGGPSVSESGGSGGGVGSELPAPLAAILRDHTLLHINALQHARGTAGAPPAASGLPARTPPASAVSSSVSPQVASAQRS